MSTIIYIGWGTKVEIFPQEIELIMWSVIIYGFDICYMLNNCNPSIKRSSLRCFLSVIKNE